MLLNKIGPLHDPVTWYKIKCTGEQVAQWDFQNKGRSRWTGTSCFVLEVPLCNLLTSIFNFVTCDRVVLRAYYGRLILRFRGVSVEDLDKHFHDLQVYTKTIRLIALDFYRDRNLKLII